MEKTRSLSKDLGITILLLAVFYIGVAFGTPAWLIRIPIISTAFEKLGLWIYCVRSISSPYEANTPARFFVHCRWFFDRLSNGYPDIQSFLLPPFMIATHNQFFFTMCFLLILISFGLMLRYVLCGGLEQKRYIQLTRIISYLSFASGFNGSIAVIIFACLGNTDRWISGLKSHYFGGSFAMGIVGSILALITGALFLVEVYAQHKKLKYPEESSVEFQLELNS